MIEGDFVIVSFQTVMMGLSALIAFAAAMKALFFAYNLPPCEFKTYFHGIGAFTFLIGIVFIGFAFCDIFRYTTTATWPAMLTSVFSLIGILAIFLIIWTVWKIIRFVGGE